MRIVAAGVVVLAGCGDPDAARVRFPLRDLGLGYRSACVVDARGAAACWGEGYVIPGVPVSTGSDLGCVEPFVPGPPSADPFGSCVTPAPMWVRTGGETLEAVTVREQATALTSAGHVARFPWLPEGCEPPCDSEVAVVEDRYTFTALSANDTGWCGLTAEGVGYCAPVVPPSSASVYRESRDPVRIPGEVVWVTLQTSGFEYVGLDADGRAWRGRLHWEGDDDGTFRIDAPARWGDRAFAQVQLAARYAPVPGSDNLGVESMCGVERGTGAVWCDGYNGFGQRGVGDFDPPADPSAPTAVVGIPAADEVAVGLGHVCARSGGELWCWGLGEWGQLGFPPANDCETWGTTERWGCQASPGVVPGITDAVSVRAGVQYVCAETRDDVFCFGKNDFGRLGDPSGSASGPLPVFD